MYRFDDYVNRRKNEDITNWPKQAWNWMTRSKQQSFDPNDKEQFQNIMRQIKAFIGDPSKNITQNPEIRNRAWQDETYLDNVFRLIGAANDYAIKLNFQDALPLLNRKRQELVQIKRDLENHKQRLNKDDAYGSERVSPAKLRQKSTIHDKQLQTSAKELYIVKALRHGVDDQEIINKLTTDYGMSPKSALRTLRKVRNVNSMT